MSKKRKLTKDEKAKIREWALARERPKYPNAMLTINVADYIDDEGKVHYTTVAMTETEMPPGWKPE